MNGARRPLRLLVSAGEPSGDLAAAEVLAALRAGGAPVEAFGLGGPALHDAGLEAAPGLPATTGALAVVGLSEAMGAVATALATVRALVGEARRRRPEAALLVDLPETNGRVAAALDCPVVRYGVPQVWAWRPGRARAIARSGAALAVTLPFEAPWWRAAGAAHVRFVGHPAVERVRAGRSGTPRAGAPGEAGPRIALLPGSRPAEIGRHWPVLAGAARLLAARAPGIRFVTTEPAPPDGTEGLPLERVSDGPAALAGARAAIAASGTVTLEAAALGVPCVVGYRLSPATWAAARALVGVPHVALPNLLAGWGVLPELLQEDFTPVAAARALFRLLEPDASRARALADVAARARGPAGGPAGAVAAWIRELTA